MGGPTRCGDCVELLDAGCCRCVLVLTTTSSAATGCGDHPENLPIRSLAIDPLGQWLQLAPRLRELHSPVRMMGSFGGTGRHQRSDGALRDFNVACYTCQ